MSQPDLTPYQGRWVALIGERIAGVGNTPDEARRLARRNRPKERASVQFVAPPANAPLPLSPLMERIRPSLTASPHPVFLVGGAVRDAVLGVASHDLDFAVPQGGIRLAFRVGDALGAPAYPLDLNRDTGRVVLKEVDTTLDFAGFRGPDLATDLRDRDFTINALALPAGGMTRAEIIDPCGGLDDLLAGQLRLTHDHALHADPLRAMRAIRQAVQFGFTLTPETETAVRAAAPSLAQVSPERVRDEIVKAMDTARPHTALHLLETHRLLPVILPEIAALSGVEQSPPHHEPVLAHTRHVLARLIQVEAALFGETPHAGEALDAMPALAPHREALLAHFTRAVEGELNGRILLRLAALFHDVGKAKTQEIEEGSGRIHFYGHDQVGGDLTADRLRQLALSKKAIRHVRDVVVGHMRPLLLVNAQGARPTRRAVYRFFRDIGPAGLDVGLLALADHLATYDGPGPETTWQHLIQMVGALYHFYFEKYDETVSPPPLLNGHHLMEALDLPPGPEIGRLLRLIKEAQAAGQIETEEEAIRFARRQHTDTTTT